ncbi:MAG: transcriptional repressor [Butyrivibrio sp.]|nr:transcriptional repressor [Butyrivibrio sp.]
MSTEQVMDRLKDNGCRITKQRKLIVDVIMNNDFTSCKDIYYQVVALDKTVGMATVYRMIRVLEDIGVVKRIDMIELNKDAEEL